MSDASLKSIEAAANLAQIAALLLGLFGLFAADRQLRVSPDANKVSAEAGKATANAQ